ncbi:efflux RND transporter periplasmic adaptor subunit [Chromatiaceae bacterium AAb-1]|nr:efflux RND transporter periplasmic adaptor subunit [Chromatiaceae bacterium AAb-1]
MQMRKKLALAGIVAFGLSGCGQSEQAAAGYGTAPAPEVEVATLQSQALVLTTELPGRTTDFRQAEVRPQVSGILQKRLFTEGQQVEAGQVLYQIDAAPYQATLNSAEAALTRAKASQHNARLKADRFKGLLNSKAVSQQDNDDAQASLLQANADVASAVAAVESARINLEYTKLRAPISGRIGRSSVTEGALLTANQAQVLATIRQLDPIYVDLTQSSSELLKLRRQLSQGNLQTKPQHDVVLLLDDGSKYEHQGALQFSEVNVDPSTGMVTLRAVFPNSDGQLLPGMFVRAMVEHAVDPDAVLVPQVAVSRTPKGQAMVMLVTGDNKVEARIIEVGHSVGDKWLVLSGLSSGDKVIVAGLQKVQPGATVRTVEASATAQQ